MWSGVHKLWKTLFGGVVHSRHGLGGRKNYFLYWLPINLSLKYLLVFYWELLLSVLCRLSNAQLFNLLRMIFSLPIKHDWTAREVNTNWTRRYKQKCAFTLRKKLCFAFMYFTSFFFSGCCVLWRCSLSSEDGKKQPKEEKKTLCWYCWNSWHCNQLENLFGKVHKNGEEIVKVYVLLKLWAAGICYQKDDRKSVWERHIMGKMLQLLPPNFFVIARFSSTRWMMTMIIMTMAHNMLTMFQDRQLPRKL